MNKVIAATLFAATALATTAAVAENAASDQYDRLKVTLGQVETVQTGKTFNTGVAQNQLPTANAATRSTVKKSLRGNRLVWERAQRGQFGR
ncbi:MAG: hypothetical protein AAF557_04115 [Pseudomonadota bacterium]